MKTTIGSFFVLFALVAGLAATAPAAFADHSEVVIVPVDGSSVAGCQDENGCYIPMVATVDVGGVVIFDNTDTVAHTFTAGTVADGPSGEFDSGLALAGSSFEYTAEEVGEIQHYCLVHPWMTGTIIVQEAQAEENGDAMNGDMMSDDKHHDDEKEGMMKDRETSATGMLSDGTMIHVYASVPMEGEPMEITVKYLDSEHVNYDLMVMQDGESVLDDMGVHDHDGKYTHTTDSLGSDSAVDINITFQGFGVDEMTGPVGETVEFTEIVPEFGTIAMMVLAVSIIAIIAVTAKSRIVPRL